MGGLPDMDEIVYEPDQDFIESTNVYEFMQAYDIADHESLIDRSQDVEWFWDVLPEYLDIEFFEDYDQVRDDSDGPQFSEWYPEGTINIAHNVLDRHAVPDSETRNTVATIWEGEEGEVREVTYHELYRQTNQVANALAERGIGEGDTVGLYMPMVPEVVSILYGCFKVGAIAVPIFSGFGVDATATRIEDSECSVLFTGDGFLRRGNDVLLKRAQTRRSSRRGTSNTPSFMTDSVLTSRGTTREMSGGMTPLAPSQTNSTRGNSMRTAHRCYSTPRGRQGRQRGSSRPTRAY